MIYNTAREVFCTAVDAYYNQRNCEKLLECVTEDIIWIGTEQALHISNKEQLERLLEKSVEQHPDSYQVIIGEPCIQNITDDVAFVISNAGQLSFPDMTGQFLLRLTVGCIRRPEGWKIFQVHASVAGDNYTNEARRKLEEERRKQEMLLNSIPGGVAVYHLKKNGKVKTEYVSEGLAKMCGYSSREFLEYLKEDAMVNLIPEDKQDVLQHVEEGLKQKKMISVSYHIYSKDKKTILIHLDANIIETDKIKEDELAVLYGVHTRVPDETIAVIEEEKRYRKILNNLDLAYFEWQQGGEFYASKRYKDYAMSYVDNTSIRNNQGPMDTIYSEDIPILLSFFDKKERHQTKVTETLRCKMVDGSYRWTEMMGFFEYDAEGNEVKTMGILRDVENEWKSQNDRLQKALKEANTANEAKTAFLSTVSHDMRTPLNGILGLTELMLEQTEDKQIINDLMKLKNSGVYLLNLINDTLDVSRIESGKMELHPSVCSGRIVMENALMLIQPLLKAKNIKLNMHMKSLPFTMLYIDVGRTEQVVVNIVGNSIKFTPEGGEIDFYMENESVRDGVITDKIVVWDHGVGISPEFLPHMFEVFSQENKNGKTDKTGTGLGLTITKKILELMGGEIYVESEKNVGTKVTFTLPMPIATEEQINNEKKSALGKEGPNYLDGKRILLCEDHPLNAAIVSRILQKKNVVIEIAENGKIGLEMFEKSSNGYYDAIIMDMRMPVMDGCEATEKIRHSSHEQAESIPIIAVTANAFDSDVKKAIESGMNAHISKPIQTDVLFSVLEEYLSCHNNLSVDDIMKSADIYKKDTVLIVDDVDVNREVMAIALGDEYDVLMAENGMEAYDVLESTNGIVAVITDLQMPVMNGQDLIKKIRSREKYNYLAIIANTQFGDPIQEEELIKIGADDFVYKPTTPGIVLARLKNVLRKYNR